MKILNAPQAQPPSGVDRTPDFLGRAREETHQLLSKPSAREGLSLSKLPLMHAASVAFMRGLVKQGPQEAFESIKAHPRTFLTGLGVMAAIGAVGVVVPAIPAAELALMISLTSLGNSLRLGYEAVKNTPDGPEKFAAMAAEMIFPTLLSGATTAAGLAIGGMNGAASIGGIYSAGVGAAESALVGSDAPTLVAMASGAGDSDPSHTTRLERITNRLKELVGHDPNGPKSPAPGPATDLGFTADENH